MLNYEGALFVVLFLKAFPTFDFSLGDIKFWLEGHDLSFLLLCLHLTLVEVHFPITSLKVIWLRIWKFVMILRDDNFLLWWTLSFPCNPLPENYNVSYVNYSYRLIEHKKSEVTRHGQSRLQCHSESTLKNIIYLYILLYRSWRRLIRNQSICSISTIWSFPELHWMDQHPSNGLFFGAKLQPQRRWKLTNWKWSIPLTYFRHNRNGWTLLSLQCIRSNVSSNWTFLACDSWKPWFFLSIAS